MTKNHNRVRRLEDQILKELADILYHKVKDPRLGFITLTDIELSKDLKHATAYYTVMENKDKGPTQYALESSRGFVRSELAKRLDIYQVPELTFRYDTSIEHGENIERLLQQLEKEQPTLSEDSVDNEGE